MANAENLGSSAGQVQDDYRNDILNYVCRQNIFASNIAEFKLKVTELSSYLLGPGRIQLLRANKSDCEELIFLILNMKKQFEHILTELGKAEQRNDYIFCCNVCDEQLSIPHINFWESIQDHEHFEECYQKCLSNGLFSKPEVIDYFTVDADLDDSNTDNDEFVLMNNDDDISDIRTEQMDPADCELNSIDLLEEFYDECNINGFRFNFPASYDKVVQAKLYPHKTMMPLKKYDKTNYPTIVSVGVSRFACLLCSCVLSTKGKKVRRQFLIDHIAGNRHMKKAEFEENIVAMESFHETWLNKDSKVQAHQVYFLPDLGTRLICLLCNVYVPGEVVLAHILSKIHKVRVLENFPKNPNGIYLLDLQVQLYGVIPNSLDNNKINVKLPNTNSEKKTKNLKSKTDKKPDKPPDIDGEESPHNIIKSIENPLSNKLSEILPYRFKNHSIFLTKIDKIIKCTVCKVQFSIDLPLLISHICGKHHLRLTGVPLIAHNYYCEVCNLKLLDEYAWLKHFADKAKLHAKLPESRRSKTAEYECIKCYAVIFGDELSLSRHLSTKSSRKKSTEIKLAPSILKIFKTREIIQAEAEKLVSEANDTLNNNGLTMQCCKSVEQIVKIQYEKCKAYPFGSRISGLGNQKSDLDLFLDVGDMYTGYNNQDSLSQIQIVKKVFAMMIRVKEEFQDVYQIPTARTPIIKFHHKKTEIDCDLSFRHGLSVENTKFLRFCCDLQPISHSFILVLKMWSHENGLSEHITTYALAMMAIFFLQTKGYLLSVKQLRQINQGNASKISGWETIDYKTPLTEIKKHVVENSGNLVELLKDFFQYYYKFMYSQDVICPLLGHCIKKKDFNDKGKNLPPEMYSYRHQLSYKEPELFRNTVCLCIQDPFDLSHNLTKALQPGTLNKFRILCDLSSKLLDSL